MSRTDRCVSITMLNTVGGKQNQHLQTNNSPSQKTATAKTHSINRVLFQSGFSEDPTPLPLQAVVQPQCCFWLFNTVNLGRLIALWAAGKSQVDMVINMNNLVKKVGVVVFKSLTTQQLRILFPKVLQLSVHYGTKEKKETYPTKYKEFCLIFLFVIWYHIHRWVTAFQHFQVWLQLRECKHFLSCSSASVVVTTGEEIRVLLLA